MFKKKIIIFISSFLVLLFSCYTHKIFLNEDKKSGKMTIEYQLDDNFFQLLSAAVSNLKTNDPKDSFDAAAIIDESLFKETFKTNEYVKLKSVSIKSNNGIYKGIINVEFIDFEKALEQLPKGLIKILVDRQNGNLTISQTFNFKELDPEGTFKEFVAQQKVDDPDFYNKIYRDAIFNFIITTAQPIIKSEGVVLSSDKKQANYTFKLKEFLDNNNKILKFLISL